MTAKLKTPPRPPVRRLTGVIAAGAAVLIAGVGVTPSLAARHKGRCDAHRAKKQTRSVLVFAKAKGSDSGGNTSTLYYACARPNGPSHPIGFNSDAGGQYSPDDTVSQLRLVGNYVAAWLVTSNASAVETCSKYNGASCPALVEATFIKVLDARSGRSTNLPTAGAPGSNPLVLSARGAVAWLDSSPPVLHATRLVAQGAKRLQASPRAVDQGNIDPRSVRFDGLTLHWTTDGQSRAASLSTP